MTGEKRCFHQEVKSTRCAGRQYSPSSIEESCSDTVPAVVYFKVQLQVFSSLLILSKGRNTRRRGPLVGPSDLVSLDLY